MEIFFLGYLSGTLASQSIRFNLPLSKGLFPHLFCQEKNFNYLGEVPANEFYLSFGETTPKEETLEYLAERRNSGELWSFNNELIHYCKKDVELLRLSCQTYLFQNFSFQRSLIKRFGSQHSSNKLPLIDAFSPPYFTLASYSFALLRTYGLAKYKKQLFTIMNPSGVHSINSSNEEWQYLSYLENFFLIYNTVTTAQNP